jgi:uncharacterized membrane protein
MNKRTVSLTILLVLTACCAAHALYYSGLLPERVAAHFNAAGMPDGWAGKETFIQIYLAAVALCTVLFFLLAVVFQQLPVSKINLPDKERLLSPQREGRTRELLSCGSAWLGSATLLFLMDIFHQSFQVALGAAGLSHPVLSIGMYLAFGICGSIWLLMQLMNDRN